MPRITVNVDEETKERLEEERERLNWSLADAGGHCIEAHLSTVEHINPQHSDAQPDSNLMQPDSDRLDDLEQRVETLEESAARRAERLAALESRDGDHGRASEGGAPADDADPSQTAESLSAARGASQQTPDAGAGESTETGGVERPPSSVRELLEDWKPGRGGEDRERRREVGAVVLETLRDDGRMSAADFRRELYPEHAVGDEKVKSWWERTAREALNHARETGAVVLHGGPNEYEWVGR